MFVLFRGKKIMKIWLSKNSEIPVREQLVTQIKIGIVGGDLPVGEKLPSTRELSRRFDIHANTVSNAYHKLCDEGWLEFKQGSGFFVCQDKFETQANTLDKLIAQFLQNTQKLGFNITEIKQRLAYFLESKLPENILVIESDLQLQAILIEEINQATNLKVFGQTVEDFLANPVAKKSNLTALSDEKTRLQGVMSPDKPCFFLHTQSVADAMKGQNRPQAEDLIAVISGWEKFLVFAKIFLLAAKVDGESLLVRNTIDNDWQKGLTNASMIICDSLTAKYFENDERVRKFRVISEQSLAELVATVVR
jgi:DNA-binding transcriptional regulator YhcF (GntR family)